MCSSFRFHARMSPSVPWNQYETMIHVLNICCQATSFPLYVKLWNYTLLYKEAIIWLIKHNDILYWIFAMLTTNWPAVHPGQLVIQSNIGLYKSHIGRVPVVSSKSSQMSEDASCCPLVLQKEVLKDQSSTSIEKKHPEFSKDDLQSRREEVSIYRTWLLFWSSDWEQSCQLTCQTKRQCQQ